MWNLFKLWRRDVSELHPHADEPTLVQRMIGTLAVPSRRLLAFDPQYAGEPIRLGPTAAIECRIEATCLIYGDGHLNIASIKAAFVETVEETSIVDTLAVDSAKAIFVDEEAFERCWTETGPDRIGVINTLRDPTLPKRLKKRYGLKSHQVDPITAHVIGPISQELEAEIAAFLKSCPEYEPFPYFFFYVQTNNSFERANELRESFAFLPVGNAPSPKMLIFATGYGDGSYPIMVRRTDLGIASVEIEFIDQETRDELLARPTQEDLN